MKFTNDLVESVQQMTKDMTELREKVRQSEMEHKKVIAQNAELEGRLQASVETEAALRAEVERYRALE